MKEWTPFWKSEEGLFSLYVEEIVIEDEMEVEYDNQDQTQEDKFITFRKK